MSVKYGKNSESESKKQGLSYYVDNRIKLMQEVLSLIKPKKIRSMAPDFMKKMNLSEIKSLLLEELLGISNKRLRSILAGENIDTVSSSSSESETEEKKCIDTISLQEITDNSDCYIDIQLSEQERLELEKDNANIDNSYNPIKTESKKGMKRKGNGKHIKKNSKKILKNEEEPVVSVLNLLELQARARAIRSQLANEIHLQKDIVSDFPKHQKCTEQESHDEDSSNSVICVSPDNLSVVSVNSKSDLEESRFKKLNDNNDHTVIQAPDKSKCSNNDLSNLIIDKSSNKDPGQKDRDESDSEPWKTRWLESKKVQDVIRTTKLYNNLRQTRKQRSISSEEVNIEINISRTNNEYTDKTSSSHSNLK